MKILGEELGNVGRWYIALPPLLLIGFLVGLFFLGAAGRSRLNAADERVHDSEIRERALNEYVALLTAAESAQRGYLLTGEDGYRKSYAGAAAKVEPALDRLRDAYRPMPEPIDEIRTLRVLTGKKLGELEQALALYEQHGAAPAVGLAGTGVGKKTSVDISNIVDSLHGKENTEFSAATAQWQSDLRLSRWITMSGAVLNIGLVILATVLVYGDMRRRARQATDLRDQKQELERQVVERTHETDRPVDSPAGSVGTGKVGAVAGIAR